MKNIISFPKIGNLKLGIVRNGKPVQTTRVLVTLPTKEGTENFKIYPGFSDEGEISVAVTLPFDDPALNFEVNYVGFLTVSDVEYIAKAEKLGDNLLFYPMNPEDFEKKVIDAGELTLELIEKYNLIKTGFLKVMIKNVSGFGEMFYFKTKSVNTIRTINDQLAIIGALTNGKVACLPLVLKPVKKDIGDKSIVFMSISFADDIVPTGGFNLMKPSLRNYIDERKESPVSIDGLEKLYKESRELTEDDIISLADETMISAVVKVDKDTDKEISEIMTEAQKATMTADEIYVHEFVESNSLDIPKGMAFAVFNAFKGDKEPFEAFILGNPTPMQCAAKINETDNS